MRHAISISSALVHWFLDGLIDASCGHVNCSPSIIIHFSSTANLTTRYIFVSSAIVGFVFFDLFYASVVINYCTQCQLIVFFIRSIMDRVRTKTHTLEVAVKVTR